MRLEIVDEETEANVVGPSIADMTRQRCHWSVRPERTDSEAAGGWMCWCTMMLSHSAPYLATGCGDGDGDGYGYGCGCGRGPCMSKVCLGESLAAVVENKSVQQSRQQQNPTHTFRQ